MIGKSPQIRQNPYIRHNPTIFGRSPPTSTGRRDQLWAIAADAYKGPVAAGIADFRPIWAHLCPILRSIYTT
jgi:hypothetical protein